MNQAESLRNRIKDGIVLMDGAMGTYFNQLHPEAGEAEEANLTHPEWIVDIHRQYIEAGAQLIRTNTFAVNHRMFAKERIPEVLQAAVDNALQAVRESGKQIWVAASVGPIHYSNEQEERDALLEYRRICDVLLEQGIRIFILETFAETALVTRLAEYIQERTRQQYGQEAFVQVQFSVSRSGYTQYGYGMQRLIREMIQQPSVTGFGFNCGIGATHMNRMLAGVTFPRECILSVLPNAGYEYMQTSGRIHYDNSTYYTAAMHEILKKGANLIGGCCGTTPEYVRALAELIRDYKPAAKRYEADGQPEACGAGRNPFIRKLEKGERVYVVEIDSPFNENADKFLEAAFRLKDNQVDLVTISDSPMARARAEAFEMGIYIAGKTGVRVMPHVTGRDRNVIGIRSAILGGYINGIRDMLIITGDPVARGDRNTVTSVFDFNSIKLMEYVKNMNRELFREDPLYYGGALNYAGVNVDAIALRMQKKMEAGCSYFLTQPVYSDSDIARVRELKERTGAKILVGLMPLISYRNAMFMKNEMAGIDVPQEVLERYHPDMTRQEAEQVAKEVTVAIGRKAMDFADGFYIMTPFNRVLLVNEIIQELRKEQ